MATERPGAVRSVLYRAAVVALGAPIGECKLIGAITAYISNIHLQKGRVFQWRSGWLLRGGK